MMSTFMNFDSKFQYQEGPWRPSVHILPCNRSHPCNMPDRCWNGGSPSPPWITPVLRNCFSTVNPNLPVCRSISNCLETTACSPQKVPQMFVFPLDCSHRQHPHLLVGSCIPKPPLPCSFPRRIALPPNCYVALGFHSAVQLIVVGNDNICQALYLFHVLLYRFHMCQVVSKPLNQGKDSC